jgi:hypothetical protein
MKLDVPLQPVEETSETVPAHLGQSPNDASLDGDVPIEGDGGTVDNSGQVYVPPPPPPRG